MVRLDCVKTLVKSTLALFAVIMTATGAYASNAKVTAMGLSTDTYWMIQHDESYIALNPAALSKQSEEIFINPVTDLGGIIVSPSNQMNLYVSTGAPLNSQPFSAWNAAAYPELTKEAINATGSYSSGSIAFGAALAFADNSSVTTDALGVKTTLDNTLIKGRLGFIKDINSTMNIDAAGGFEYWNKSAKVGAAKTDTASPFDFNALARFNMSFSEISKLHLFGGFSSTNRDEKVGGTTGKNSYFGLSFGASDEMTINKSTTVYAGMNYSLVSNENKAAGTKVTTDDSYWKVSAGVDTALTDSFNLRFGANRKWYSNTTIDHPKSDTTTEAPTTFCIGLGYKIGNVDFDWQAGMGMFQNGPYLISGQSSASTNFEVTYHFDTTSASASRSKR